MGSYQATLSKDMFSVMLLHSHFLTSISLKHTINRHSEKADVQVQQDSNMGLI